MPFFASSLFGSSEDEDNEDPVGNWLRTQSRIEEDGEDWQWNPDTQQWEPLKPPEVEPVGPYDAMYGDLGMLPGQPNPEEVQPVVEPVSEAPPDDPNAAIAARLGELPSWVTDAYRDQQIGEGNIDTFLRETVKPAVREAVETVASPLDYVPGAEYQVPGGPQLGSPYSENVGTVAEAFVPQSSEELILEAIPGVGAIPGAASAGRKVVGAALREAVTPSPSVLRVAARPDSVLDAVEEGLAGARGAVRIADPTGVRVLAPDEMPAPGEIEFFHGTTGVEGDLKPGTFLTPNPDDAMTYARASANAETQPAGPLRRAGEAVGGVVRAGMPEPNLGGANYGSFPVGPGDVRRDLPPIDNEAIPAPASPTPLREGAVPSPGQAPAGAGLSIEQRRAPPPNPPQPPAPPTGNVPPNDFAGNIRLDKYPEDIRDPIRQWANDHPDEVEAARRGVRSDEQVRADAQALIDDIGGSGKFELDVKAWKAGEAWNAEEIVAIRGALTDATKRVRAAAEVATAAPGDIGKHLDLASAIMEQQRLQQIVHGVTAEAGRALRQFRQKADTVLASGDVRQAQELLQRSIGTSDPEDIKTLATALAVLDETKPQAANRLIRDVNKPDFWDKLHFYWINSILSGPVTQARNIVGNAGASLYMPVQRLAAATIEQPLAAVQGRQAQRFWQEAPASVMGIFQGLPEGVRGALTTITTGISPRAAAKMEVRPQPIGGIAGRVIGAPTTALGAMDEFFSAINYRASLNANAVRMARTEGLKGPALTNRIADLVNDPPPNLMKQSTDQAETLVFRGDPGNVARAVAYLRKEVPGGRYVLPFLSTPANLLKAGVKNSPLGLLDANSWRKAIAGNPEGADELAKGVMGSMIAASLGSLVATGQIDITAAVPVDRAERDRFFREGKLPFSVKIPGIGWVEYKQVPALDTTFTLVASAVDGIRRGEDVQGIATQAGANIATNLLDKSYMSGIGDLFDAVQDPVRYAERYVTRHLSGYVPFSGLSRQTAGFFDRTVRDPKGMKEQLRTQIPGLSKTVPPRLTAFGEEARRGLPSPVQVSPDRQSAVDAELERIGKEVTFVGTTIGGERLSRYEQSAYQAMAGQTTKMILERTIASPAYQALDDLDKEQLLDKLITGARTPIRELVSAVMGQEGYEALSEEDRREAMRRLTEKWIRRIGERELVGAR